MKKTWVPEMSGAWVSWTRIGFGMTLYYLFVPNFAGPLGFVWGVAHGKERFDTYGSFVEATSRRFGVRTRINREIQKYFEVIATDQGTKDGGTAFLKASGYRYNKSARCFVLASKRKRT